MALEEYSVKFTSDYDKLKSTDVCNEFEYPRFSLGFNHFYHATINKMFIFNEFIGKKKVYLIFSNCEIDIPDYDDDIKKIAEAKLKSKITRKMLKYYELFSNYQLKKNILIISDNSIKIVASAKLFIDNISTSEIDKKINKSFDFVVFDAKLKWTKNNIQEQQLSNILIKNMENILHSLKKDATFVCKFYEMYTTTTIKILLLLYALFDKIVIYKPTLSRDIDSERFIVCYKFNPTKINKYLDKYLKINIPDDVFKTINEINLDLANRQYIMINEMVKYIEEQNFYGKIYNQKRENQIENSKKWIKNYL